MWCLSWLRDRASTHAPRGRAQRRPAALRFRPRLEALEGRWVPSTLVVNSTADDGSIGTLRYEIAQAHSGDIIDLSAVSGQTIDLSKGELVLNESLTIRVPAVDKPVTIFGYGPIIPVGVSISRVFEVDGATTVVALSNLTISSGNGYGGAGNPTNGNGGGIWNGGTLTLTACNLTNNSGATLGGAIYNAGTLTINSCTVDNNTAGQDNSALAVGNSPGNGGAIYNTGTLKVNASILDDNTAVSDGGQGLSAGGFGGGIFNASNATATVTGGSISGNDAYTAGGGIYNGGTMTLSGNTVSGNHSLYGSPSGYYAGGILNDKKGRLTIQSQSKVVNNGGQYDLYNLGGVKISKDSAVGLIGP